MCVIICTEGVMVANGKLHYGKSAACQLACLSKANSRVMRIFKRVMQYSN